MTKQVIDIGTVVQNGRDGDNARTSSIKVNANFTELYDKDSAVDSELATKATKTELTAGLGAKVDKVAGKGLSTNDYTTTEKSKLASIADGAQVNSVISVAGRTGVVVLSKADVGLSNVDNTSDANKPVSSATQTALNLKASSTDPRLSDSREWSAETVSQAEAEAGIATTRRAWTSQRVRQAIVAWWGSVSTLFGRSLINSADASAARNSLGLGTAATATITTSADDVTAGRVLRVGDGGFLSTASSPIIAEMDNTATPTGTKRYANGISTGTKPVGAAANAILYFERFNGSITRQLWTDVTGGATIPPRTWIRTSYATNTWTDWSQIYQQADPQPIVLTSFTLATLPSAAANPRLQVYCSNLADQAAPVFSDGTNWRRVSDNSIAN